MGLSLFADSIWRQFSLVSVCWLEVLNSFRYGLGIGVWSNPCSRNWARRYEKFDLSSNLVSSGWVRNRLLIPSMVRSSELFKLLIPRSHLNFVHPQETET
uniref:Uncharacterized protein n=1 Tax=Spongospora subterranea TaxID=70186 RepID=A0A0H5RCY7_9EUKA|eukprot:CRZ11621.1 hypothetical protein [Spongospora subterranea]